MSLAYFSMSELGFLNVFPFRVTTIFVAHYADGTSSLENTKKWPITKGRRSIVSAKSSCRETRFHALQNKKMKSVVTLGKAKRRAHEGTLV